MDLSGPGPPRIGVAAAPTSSSARLAAVFRVAALGPDLASGLRWRAVETTSPSPETRSEKEHAMMFAFALALVGVAVLGSLNLAAARAR